MELHYVAHGAAWSEQIDLLPGSTMTNANVASKVTAAGARELTLQYKDGAHRIIITEGVPIVRSLPGDAGRLGPGRIRVRCSAQAEADGALSAARVQVSKDGVEPAQ